MKRALLSLLHGLFFLLHLVPLIYAQEDQCFPGLEQIPPVADSDASTTSNFVGQGGQIYGVQITAQQIGDITGIAVIRASGTVGAKIALYADDNNTPSICLTPTNAGAISLPNVPQGFGDSPRVDTTFVYFSEPIMNTEVNTKFWGCVKFSSTGPRMLRQFPDVEGLRFSRTNGFNIPFPADLTGDDVSDIQPGLYGIYLIMENAKIPLMCLGVQTPQRVILTL